MAVPQYSPWPSFHAVQAQDHEGRYEAKILQYLLSRYAVSKEVKNQLYSLAERRTGQRRPTLEQLAQLVDLPLVLRSRLIYQPTNLLTIASALNGKAFSGPLGQSYQDVLDSVADLAEMNHVIGMCFGYPYLKLPGSAASLVLHNGMLSTDEIAESPGVICCCGDDPQEVWVIEPLGRLLDRLDGEHG